MPIPNPDNLPRQLTLKQVAAYLCVSRATVRRWVRRDKLPGFQYVEHGTWFVGREDLLRFENSRKHQQGETYETH